MPLWRTCPGADFAWEQKKLEACPDGSSFAHRVEGASALSRDRAGRFVGRIHWTQDSLPETTHTPLN